MSHYPDQPGCRTGSPQTSLLAALDAAKTAPRAIDRILEKLAEGPASPEELHAAFVAEGEPLLLTSIRARVTQLKRLGRVIDSGERGLGESLKSKVRKMRLTTPAEMSDALTAQHAREEAAKGGGQ